MLLDISYLFPKMVADTLMMAWGEKNVAMLYVVGPKGTGAPGGHGPTMDSNTEFLAAVEDMASNAISIVAAYNAEIKDDSKGVDVGCLWAHLCFKVDWCTWYVNVILLCN